MAKEFLLVLTFQPIKSPTSWEILASSNCLSTLRNNKKMLVENFLRGYSQKKGIEVKIIDVPTLRSMERKGHVFVDSS